MEKKLLTIKQAADYLQVHENTVKRHLYNGQLRGYKAGRQWRIQKGDLEAFLKSNK